MARLPMEPSDLNPTRTQACPQVFVEENSQEMPAASQPVSDVFMQNLSDLTLNPSTQVAAIQPEHPPRPTGQRPAFQSDSDVFRKNQSLDSRPEHKIAIHSTRISIASN